MSFKNSLTQAHQKQFVNMQQFTSNISLSRITIVFHWNLYEAIIPQIIDIKAVVLVKWGSQKKILSFSYQVSISTAIFTYYGLLLGNVKTFISFQIFILLKFPLLQHRPHNMGFFFAININ